MASATVTNDTTIDPAEAAHFAKRWPPIGGTRADRRRCSTGSIRCGSGICESGSICIGAATAPASRRLPGRPRSTSVAVRGCCASRSRGSVRAVTGVDAAAEAIAVARDHAARAGLAIDYRAGELATVAGQFDLVTSMEVIEHVADPAVFVAQLADRLAPGGLLVMSTPNRTALSRLAMITLAEGTGRIPRGTHDWSKFLTPDELVALIEQAGLACYRYAGAGVFTGQGVRAVGRPKARLLRDGSTALSRLLHWSQSASIDPLSRSP